MAPPPSRGRTLSPGTLFACTALILIALSAHTAHAAMNDTAWFDDPMWDNASFWGDTANISEQPPPESEPACIETWECGRWSSCQDNSQARYCFDAAGCSTDLREEAQACETPEQTTPAPEEPTTEAAPQAPQPPENTTTEASQNTYAYYHSSRTASTEPCFEIWQCEKWSACDKGIQARTCSDSNHCGTTTQQPALTQTCESCLDHIRNQNEEDVDCGGPCDPCIDTAQENILIQLGPPPTAAKEQPPIATAIRTPVKSVRGTALIWMLIGALALAGTIYLYMRKLQAEQMRKLSTMLSPTQIAQVTLYVREALAHGKKQKELREELTYHGYTKDLIAAVFRRAKH